MKVAPTIRRVLGACRAASSEPPARLGSPFPVLNVKLLRPREGKADSQPPARFSGRLRTPCLGCGIPLEDGGSFGDISPRGQQVLLGRGLNKCSQDLTRSKGKGKKDTVEPLPEAVFSHPLVTNVLQDVLGPALSPAYAPWGWARGIFVTCVVKEALFDGGSSQPHLSSSHR